MIKQNTDGMKRSLTLLVMLLAISSAMAQNPKAVMKSIAEGDLLKATEKFDKISDKTISKMPEMYNLVRASLLAMPDQSGEDKVKGYEILVNNIDDIRNSEHLDKVIGKLNITLDDIVFAIEIESYKYIVELDEERDYILYLNMARKGKHSRIADIESHLERCRFQNVMDSNSTDDCDYFIELYPESKYREDVVSHRIDILYNEAMETTDEAVMEHFIESYPNYASIKNVTERLMQSRFNRIFAGNNVEEMKWFVQTYPHRNDIDMLKQKIANIEFPELEFSVEAIEKFIAFYPNVSQIDEARKMLSKALIIEQGDIKEFVAYVKENGYDEFYPEMVRAIYACSKRYIITPDLSDATLIHFATEEGLSGYMDLEGNTVIEPVYSCERTTYGYGMYNTFMLSEFTSYRSVALLKKGGKWGVIDTAGNTVIDFKYELIGMYSNEILAVANVSRAVVGLDEEEEYCDVVPYYCDIYDLEGNLLKHDSVEYIEEGFQLNYREFVNNKGEIMGSYLTPKYCIYHDNNQTKRLINRNGEEQTIYWTSEEEVTDDIVVIYLNDGNLQGRYFVDLSEYRAIKKCPYQEVYPMSNGRAMVYDGNKYGFIDESLELVIECKFDMYQAHTFNCGLIVVRDGEKLGLINTNGEYVLRGADYITDLNSMGGMAYNLPGLFMVGNGNIYTLIDATGASLVEIEDEYMPEVIGNYVKDSKGNKHFFYAE